MRLALVTALVLLAGPTLKAEIPVFETVFPAGGAVGSTVDVKVSGSHLEQVDTLHTSVPGLRCEKLEPERFRLTIPSDSMPGMYDLWAVSPGGVSAPRSFLIGNRAESSETEPNDTLESGQRIATCGVLNGRIEPAGDLDWIQFEARRGERVVIECWAARIDSRLRAVLEVFDLQGRRHAVNRGYFDTDPLIDFYVPADGVYVVKVQDLTSTGGAEHYYRVDIDTGPRVAFAIPSVVERGRAARVELFGWNLNRQRESTARASPAAGEAFVGEAAIPAPDAASETATLDRMFVDIPASFAASRWPLPIRHAPPQAAVDGFAYHLPGSHMSLKLGVSDVPVVVEQGENQDPAKAQLLVPPCEVSGRLTAPQERDWYAVEVRRGEVFYVEGLADRIASPLDLDISVLDASGQSELARFSDEVLGARGTSLPLDHFDPAGRWVAPADGRYLIMVRNLLGSARSDPHRHYRLSVRREEPDFQLVAVPHSGGLGSLNINRDGRALLEILAFRRRGCEGSIRITAGDLPRGIECPDVWLGPGVNRGCLVVTAMDSAPPTLGRLDLEGTLYPSGPNDRHSPLPAALHERRVVRGGTVVRSGVPTGWSRLAAQLPLVVSGEAPVRITANGHEPLDHHLYGELQVTHSPGGILDVAIDIERRDANHQAPVKLIGMGLPETIGNQTAVIPPGQARGYLSFYLPPTLPAGWYSMVVRAETTIPAAADQTESVTVFSNPVTFEVHPAAFHLQVDAFAPQQARRGDVLQVRYSVLRRNGFIGKVHTELATPGIVTDVAGLRARGETFVGQTEQGFLQITVNDDAGLGRPPFLRLFTVGVVEDQPVHFGSCFYNLEIVAD